MIVLWICSECCDWLQGIHTEVYIQKYAKSYIWWGRELWLLTRYTYRSMLNLIYDCSVNLFRMLLEMVDLPCICVKRRVLRICFVLWLITFWLGLNVVCEMIDLLIVCWFVSSAFTSLHLCIFLGIFNGNFAMKQLRWLE